MAASKLNRLLVGACSAFALMVLACTPAAQPTTPNGDPTITPGDQSATKVRTLEDPGQRGGKLTMSAAASIFGNPNDPHLFTTASGRVFSMPITNGIVKRDIYDPNYTITPDLAEKWEVSKDSLTYTFKLRQGIKFQNVAPVNGREFTSEDAKYSLLRITADPSIVAEKNKIRFQRKEDFGPIKSIETPDKYTLVVNLKEPFAPFMDSMAHPGTLVVPKEFVDKFPDGLITEGMVGTGPYFPNEFKNQQLMSFKRNPDYWRKDSKGAALPYLDEVVFAVFTDEQSKLASFRSRQIDTSTVSSAGSMESIRKDDPTVKVLSTKAVSLANFRFNTKFKPFQDVRVRRAIHLAIDRQQFLDILAEGRGSVSGPVTPIFSDLANSADWLLQQPGYRKDKKQDIEEAKRLLKEAGYSEGLSFTTMFSDASAGGADWGALLADQLKAINVTSKTEVVNYAGQWIPRSTNGEFELGSQTHPFNTDADSFLSAHLHSTGGRNYGKFNDPKLDELIVKQRTTVDPEARKKWAQEAEKYILEVVPMAILYQGTNLYMIQPWVHNASNGPVTGHEFNSVEWAWLDKR